MSSLQDVETSENFSIQNYLNPHQVEYTPTTNYQNQNQSLPQSATNQNSLQSKKVLPKSSVVEEIEKLKKNREERRMKMEHIKKERAEREAENEANGRAGDVEFDLMIDKYRIRQHLLQQHTLASNVRLCVCVRKRPIFTKEESNGEIDAISCANPQVVIHECKFKVDGISKYVENHGFTFDNSFNQDETNDDVYEYAVSPHVDLIMNQGVVTCFAYGQTGSGKTFTMVFYMIILNRLERNTTEYYPRSIRFSKNKI
jgi:kinesin family member 2/24